jgi:UDP-2,4-diacetamido-2,4,6-trideoxy-beta-L-altropyranose hydrolase
LRVLFRCDAGKEDGLGHVMRCLTLADAMRSQGETVTFCSVIGSQMVGAERIEARGFPCIAAAGPAASQADKDALADLSRDVFIIDSRRATAGYVNGAAKQGFTVVIDDDGMVGLDADIVINSELDPASERYPDRASRRFDLFGPRYNLIDPAMFAARPLAAVTQRLLVTFGGEDPFNHTRWALDSLAPTIAGLAVTVVTGPAHPDPVSARVAAAKIGATVIDAPMSLTPHILNSDLAITAGGTTCYELAAAGVPMLAIGIEPHQKHLIDALAARGACLPLGMGFDIDVVQASCALRPLIEDSDARSRMRAAEQALFPGPGAPLIADAIRVAFADRQRPAHQSQP